MGSRDILLLCLTVLAGCGAPTTTAAPPKGAPPRENDWSTIYEGAGSVEARIHNGSAAELFVKLKSQDGKTAAQAPVPANGQVSVFLRPGHFRTQLRLARADGFRFFEAPPIDIPSGVAGLELTLAEGMGGNLTAIDEAEFQR